MSRVEFKFNREILDKIKRELEKNVTVAIGVLTDAKHPSSQGGIATIAAVHEFGSKTKNIPQRSFLRLTLARRQQDFKNLLNEKQDKILKEISEGKLTQAFEKLGAWWVSAVHDTFDAQGYGRWRDLAEGSYKETRKNKGNKRGKTYKLLMVTGALRRSIIHEVIEK